MTLSLDSARDALALPVAGALLEELAVIVAEQDLLSDDEYDPELDVDPTDAEYAVDFGDTSSQDINLIGAGSYALNAGMPAISWRQARKNAREHQNALRAARQFKTYSLSQYALYATGRITLDVLNARILASFRKQARNAYIAGRRTMGLYGATSADDEAALQTLLTIDETNLDQSSSEQANSERGAGLFSQANSLYNQYQNAEMAKEYGGKLLGQGEEDAQKGLRDAAKDFGLKTAAIAGVTGAERLDTAAGYKEGWDQLNTHLDAFGNRVENYSGAGELNAMGQLPGDAVLAWWRLGEADHCEDCIALSDASPLYLSVLDADGIYPGSGHTQCGGNCHCELDFETPDQVCADSFGGAAGDPSMTLMESAAGGRLNVYIQEADTCANPVDLSSLDVPPDPSLDESSAYNWDEDVQNTFSGDVLDTAQSWGDLATAGEQAIGAAPTAMVDIGKLFDFINGMVPPDVMPELRVSHLKDATSTYHYVWHEGAHAIVYHAGLISSGPSALEHEFTLRSLSQLSALAKEKGKALVIDGKAASPGMRKWLDALGAEHQHEGSVLPSVHPKWPAVYTPPKDIYVPSHITLGVSRMRPELGEAQTLEQVNKLHQQSVILDAEATTLPDLGKLHVATEGQQEVIGRYTFGDVSGGEPSLLVSLNAHKVDLADVDIAGAYLVRRNLQDSVVATFVGDEMKRMGLVPNGVLISVTGLPVNKMQEVYDAVRKLVPVASIDAIHGVVEFSTFVADATPELDKGFAAIAAQFPGAKVGVQEAHVRWYFHDDATRAAVDYLHGPASDLLTADEVIANNASDLRTLAIPANRNAVSEQVAGGVAGTAHAAVTGYGLGRPEADLRALLDAPLPTDATDKAAQAGFFGKNVETSKAYQAWADALTEDERAALDHYQKGASEGLNTWLRAGSPMTEQYRLQAALAKTLPGLKVQPYANQAAAIDAAIAKGKLPEALAVAHLKDPQVVYRGVAGKFSLPKVGDILSDRAYVSTTLDPFQGEEFATAEALIGAPKYDKAGVLQPTGETHVLYRYALPKDFNGAYLNGFFAEGTYASEAELLLPRNTTFRVVKVERNVEVKLADEYGTTKTLDAVVDLVPESSIEYRPSEDWLKTVKPHFVPPPKADLVLDPHTKLGGLTQKAIFVDPKGAKYLFKPKKVFINDIGLSMDAANVEKTADYVADMLKLDVKPVEPYIADFPVGVKKVEAPPFKFPPVEPPVEPMTEVWETGHFALESANNQLVINAVEKGSPWPEDINKAFDEYKTYHGKIGENVGSDLQAALRSGAKLTPAQTEMAALLDKGASMYQTDEPMALFRGVPTESVKALKVGDEYADAAYVSASTGPIYATGFTTKPDETMFRIAMPKGAMFGTPSEAPEHMEVLLPRGQKWQVAAIHEDVALLNTQPARHFTVIDLAPSGTTEALTKETGGNIQRLVDDVKPLTAALESPVPVDPTFFKPIEPDIPTGSLKTIKSLGGSTGAQLVEDPATGLRYVDKFGASAAHVTEEYTADRAYEAMGFPVTRSALQTTAKGPMKRATYIEGTPLRDWWKTADSAAKDAMREQLQAGMAMDALMANWDVIGLEGDNILIDKAGKAFRIDNGGALRYRAQGAAKGKDFGTKVGELARFRDTSKDTWATRMFGSTSDAEVRRQVEVLDAHRAELLAAMPDDLKAAMSARLDDMLAQTKGVVAAEGKPGLWGAVEKGPALVLPKVVVPEWGSPGEMVAWLTKEFPGTKFDSLGSLTSAEFAHVRPAMAEFARLQRTYATDIASVEVSKGVDWSASIAHPKDGKPGAITIGLGSPVVKTGSAAGTTGHFLVDDTPAGVMRHEYGHVVAGTYSDRIPDNAKAYLDLSAKFQADPSLLSSYAVSGFTPHEVTAEIFAAVAGTAKVTDPDLLAIRDLLTQHVALGAEVKPMEVIDALTPTQVSQLAQHQVFDWLVGNDDGHIGQWLIDGKDGHIIGIDKDAAIWELPAQYAAGNNTMNDGKGYARAIFDHPTTERLAKLDPAAIADTLNRAGHITDAQYIEMFQPVLKVLTSHPNAVKMSEADWMGVILKRKHELRHDVDTYYAAKIAEVKKAGIVLPPKWAEWDKSGQHFAADTDITSALHLEAKGPPVAEPTAGKDGVGFKPLDTQQYMVGGSPIPLNAPIPAWSGFVPPEPPLPPIKATAEELATAKAEAHAVFRDIAGVVDGKYPIGISVTPEDSIAAEKAGLVGGKFSGIRLYAKDEATLQPIKDYLALPGHSSFDREFDLLVGYSPDDISKLDAYDAAKKGMSMRAGAVVVEPDGRMWTIAPSNKFGGYVNTWVKGGVDGTETTAETAVREVREETGIAIELDSYLGDYANANGDSMSRMYIAHRVGGGPLYVTTPKETYKVKLMTPTQAEKNLVRTSGKPDIRDQLILSDVRAALNGKEGDLQYVIPADDVGQFHKSIALTKSEEAVPSVLPSAVPVIDFSPNPVTIDVVKPGTAFAFDPSKVDYLHGTEVDYPASSKSFPMNTTVWKPAAGGEYKAYWKPPTATGGIFWANSKKQLDDPFERMNVNVAQLRKFGEMFEADPKLVTLTINNALLDQVPRLKEMVAAVGVYTPGLPSSKVDRVALAKLLDVTKGVPISKASDVVRIPTAPHDPLPKALGRSGVETAKLGDLATTVTATALPIAVEPPVPAIEDLKKLGVFERKAAFEQLTQEQRDLMANAVETVPARVSEVADKLGPRPTFDEASTNVLERDKQLAKAGLVTSQGRDFIRNYSLELRDDLYAAMEKTSGKVDKVLLNAMVLDTYDNMVAQEVETIGQVLGDHGARHIIGDFNTAWDVLKVVPGNDDVVTKALLKLAAPLHDLGYLTPTGRAILTSEHERWGMQAFKKMSGPNIEAVFGKDAADKMAVLIETHASDVLDWTADPMGSAFRLADNLALFEKEKLPALIAYVKGNDKVLIDYADGKLTLAEAKTKLQDNIAATMLPKAVHDQLMAAVEEVGPTLPKFTIGMFGGHIGAIGWAQDHVTVDLVRGPANEALAKVVDVGQSQFAKFAKSYGLDGKAFVDDGTFVFKNADGKVALTASIVTPKGVLVDMRDLTQVTDPDTATLAAMVKATGPPQGLKNIGEEFHWNLPDAVKQPVSGTLLAYPVPKNMFIGGSVSHLDGPTQLNVLAATMAKVTIPDGMETFSVGSSFKGSAAADAWLKKTFGANIEPLTGGTPAEHRIPIAQLQAWQAKVKADFVDAHLDVGLLSPVEHPELVSMGVTPGNLAAKYGWNTDMVSGLTPSALVAGQGDSGSLSALQWIAPDGTSSKALFVLKGTQMEWVNTQLIGVSLAAREATTIRQLHWFGDFVEQHPTVETLHVNKFAVSGVSGAKVRALLGDTFFGLGLNDEWVLNRSQVLAIRDALDKEIMPHAVAEALPEAGIARLIPPEGKPVWKAMASGSTYQTALGSALLTDAGGMLHYYPGDTVLGSAEKQLADMAAMHDIVVPNQLPILGFYNIDPEAASAMESYGATVMGSQVAMKHDDFVNFSNALAVTGPIPARFELSGATTGSVVKAAFGEPTVLKGISDEKKMTLLKLFDAPPTSETLLPSYKTYAKGEIQLRKTTYSDASSVIWRRWGNRLEAWEMQDATSIGQMNYLSQAAKTMEAYPKIAYLRILKPDDVYMSVGTMLKEAGATPYAGGLRIERADLIKLRDQMKTDLTAATAVAPKAEAAAPEVLHHMGFDEKYIEATNGLSLAVTTPDKYKFTWATYTGAPYAGAAESSAKVVTRTSKTELWWRTVVDGEGQATATIRELAAVREWVRQGDEFDKHPEWLRMRITGLTKLSTGFKDTLKTYGAETISADTLHMSREKVLALRDAFKHDLGMAESKVVAPLAGADSDNVFALLHTSSSSILSVGYETKPPAAGASLWQAVFPSGTAVGYKAGGLTGDDLMVEGILFSSMDPGKQGAEFAYYLQATSATMVKTDRSMLIREQVIKDFPELRAHLEAAGATWDNGYLRIDPALSKQLGLAFTNDTAIKAVVAGTPVVSLAPSAVGVKLSAQMGFDKMALDSAGVTYHVDTLPGGGTIDLVGSGSIQSIVTMDTAGNTAIVEPWSGTAPLDKANAVWPLAQIAKLNEEMVMGGTLAAKGADGVRFTKAWLDWAGQGVRDFIAATSAADDGEGGLFVHRFFLSKMAAKIEDDIAVDGKLLAGSAAAVTPLVSKPLIADVFNAATTLPAEQLSPEQLGKYIGHADTTGVFGEAARTTKFDNGGPTYAWSYSSGATDPKFITVDSYTLGPNGYSTEGLKETKAAMVALVYQFGAIADNMPSIDAVVFNVSGIGNVQTSWLKSFGAAVTKVAYDGSASELMLNRADLLALRTEIDNQLMGKMASVVSAAVSPNLAAVLSAAKIDDASLVAKAGALWTDKVLNSAGGTTVHEAALGTLAKAEWSVQLSSISSSMPDMVLWSKFAPDTGQAITETRAQRVAVFRGILSAVEANPAIAEFRIGPGVFEATPFAKVLTDAGALTKGAALSLTREQALALKGILDTIPGAGMGVLDAEPTGKWADIFHYHNDIPVSQGYWPLPDGGLAHVDANGVVAAVWTPDNKVYINPKYIEGFGLPVQGADITAHEIRAEAVSRGLLADAGENPLGATSSALTAVAKKTSADMVQKVENAAEVLGETPAAASLTIDTKAIKALDAKAAHYNSELGGSLFSDNIGIQYNSAPAATYGLRKPDETVLYENVMQSKGGGTFEEVTDPSVAANHLLADLHNDFSVGPFATGAGLASHDAIFDQYLVEQTGLGDVLKAYGAVDSPTSHAGLFMTSDQLKTLAADIEADTLKGAEAVVAAAPAVVHTSVGTKYGFDLSVAKGLTQGGGGGGKLTKGAYWYDQGAGSGNSARMGASWAELKSQIRWDDWKEYKPYYDKAMSDVAKEAAGYRALGLLVKKASLEGKGLGVQEGVLGHQAKLKNVLEGFGAKEKTLSTAVGKGLVLTPEQVSSLDAAFEREKMAAVKEAVPTGKYLITGEPLSKQSFGFDPSFLSTKATFDGTVDGLAHNPYIKLPGDGWRTSTWQVENPWNAANKNAYHVIDRYAPEKLGGMSLTIGYADGMDYARRTKVMYARLTEVLNDTAHPVDLLRVSPGFVGQDMGRLFESLGATKDATTGEWLLNEEQTKLLAKSLKDDVVAWDPGTGYKPGAHIEPPMPVAQVSTVAPPQPVMSPTPVPAPPPVVTPPAMGLAAAYGYSPNAQQALAKSYHDTTIFNENLLTVGKYGPSYSDVWASGLNKVNVKWGFDDHKGVHIAHIRSLTGPVESQTAVLLAHLEARLAGDFFVSNPYNVLSRVIIDKKALAAIPKAEQMLKNAGWKETKAYWTADKSHLTKLVDEVKADKATWQTAAAIAASVPAVPIGAGQGLGFVMPKAVSTKLAKPSFIYDFDKATTDTAYAKMAQTDLGVLPTLGGDAQTYQLSDTVSGASGKWSVSPSGKTVGWYEFVETGNPAADSASAMAMLRKIAEDAQNRSDKFWVKPDVYDKVPGLRQLLLDAGGVENAYPKLGTAIEMKAATASKLVQAISGDVMTGLSVTIKTPSDYLLFDKVKAMGLFGKDPIVTDAGAMWNVTPKSAVSTLYHIEDRQATWTGMAGDLKEGAGLAAIAQLDQFNDIGVPNVLIKKDVLALVPKLSQFLLASGGTVEADAIRLDATSLNNVAKFLHHEALPEALGGTKLPYSVIDDMAASQKSVTEALHAAVTEPDGLAMKSTFTVGSNQLATGYLRSQENIYWRTMAATGASAGQARAVAVAQLRTFVTDMAQNANLQRLDVDTRVFSSVPHVKDVLLKYGATEEKAADGSTYWSLDRARAEKLRTAIDKELGEVLSGPAGYAYEQARVINWPDAATLTPVGPGIAVDGKRMFTDSAGNQWAFRPGESGRIPVTDAAVSELARLMGLPVPSVRLYTLNIARPGDPPKFVQGSLIKLLPSVKPVVLSQMTPSQVQDIIKHSVLDWVVANDDAQATNYILNAADDKLWAVDKSWAWAEFHGVTDVLNRASDGLAGPSLLNSFFRDAVDHPDKLRLIHPTNIGLTLRHLQEISDDEFIRIVTPVAHAMTLNPLYKGNPEKFIADMLARKQSAASDFEAYFRTQIKDAMVRDTSRVPTEWQDWLTKGGVFDLNATPEDLWQEKRQDLLSKWEAQVTTNGVWDPQKYLQAINSSVYEPIRDELHKFYGSGATGHTSKGWGGELIRPNLQRRGLQKAMDDWHELVQLGLLQIVNGEAGPTNARYDATLRKFFNKETGTFRVVRSTSRYGTNPQSYLDHYNKEGIRDIVSSAIGTHVTVGGGGGVWLYIDLPYDQLFAAKAIGGMGAEGEEISAMAVRPEQLINIRKYTDPMDLTKLMDYNGPVISGAYP